MSKKNRLVQCQHCGHIWEPRKVTVKYCPRCKRWCGDGVRDLGTGGDNVLPKDIPPIWEKEATLLVLEKSRPCSVCGKHHTRLLRINNRLFCRACIYRLMDENSPEDEFYY